MEGYLTTREVAERLNVNYETVRRWIRSKRLKADNICSLAKPVYRISQESLNQFLNEK